MTMSQMSNALELAAWLVAVPSPTSPREEPCELILISRLNALRRPPEHLNLYAAAILYYLHRWRLVAQKLTSNLCPTLFVPVGFVRNSLSFGRRGSRGTGCRVCLGQTVLIFVP